MQHCELNPRLSWIANRVRHGARFADIGTDHAKLPVYLVQKGIACCAIASDIGEAPAKRAAQNIQACGLSKKIQVVVCDGLQGVVSFAPTDIAICGMGGETICAILQEADQLKDPKVRLLLQPMTDFALLRRFLSSRGFGILDEEIVESEHRLYQCLAVSFTGCPYTLTEAEAEVGPLNIKRRDPVFLRYVRRRAGIVQACMDGKRAAGAGCAKEHALLAAYMKILQEECL